MVGLPRTAQLCVPFHRYVPFRSILDRASPTPRLAACCLVDANAYEARVVTSRSPVFWKYGIRQDRVRCEPIQRLFMCRKLRAVDVGVVNCDSQGSKRVPD